MKTNVLDGLERVLVVVLALAFCARFGWQVPAHPHYALLIVQEGLVALLVVFRPWGATMALKPRTVALALIGTMLPFLVVPLGFRPELVTFGGAIMSLGLLLSISGKVALNRRFGLIAANRGVQGRGPYAFVRHPIYAGYTMSHVGFLITNPAWWNVIVYATSLCFQLLRIVEEEKFLNADPQYRAYTNKVRFRLLPGLF